MFYPAEEIRSKKTAGGPEVTGGSSLEQTLSDKKAEYDVRLFAAKQDLTIFLPECMCPLAVALPKGTEHPGSFVYRTTQAIRIIHFSGINLYTPWHLNQARSTSGPHLIED